MRNPKVLLVFPPEWLSFQPYLSLPCLTAFLRQQSVEVQQLDLNIEAWDRLLSPGELRKADLRLQQRFKRLKKDEKIYESLLPFIISSASLIENIDRAKEIRRSSDFYDIKEYLWSRNQIRLGWNLIKAAYNPNEFSFNIEGKRFIPKSSEQILHLTKDEDNNTFLNFYRQYALGSILPENPTVVGISIVDAPQIIPGLTLSRLIKESDPNIHVVIGGNIFTRWKDVLPKKPELFSLFDSVITQEGEHAFFELIKQLSTKKDFSQVPNFIYKNNENIEINSKTIVENIEELPTPDFDGLPLESYLSPQLILPVYSSRGCYWRKCAFCDHGYGYPEGYRIRPSQKVCEDLAILAEKHNTNLFFFVDELISPKMYKSLSQTFLDANIDINWSANARFEAQFNTKLFSKIKKSGCHVIYWGLEAGTQRVLDLMNKGINIQEVKRICADSRRVGIWNHVFVFIGFPGETQQESIATMDFIFENQNIIQTVGAGAFSLNKHAPVFKKRKKYRVKILQEGDFLLQFPYKPESGIDQREAEELSAKFNERLKRNLNDFNVWGAIPSEHMILYLANSGQNIMLEQAEYLKNAVTQDIGV